VQYVVIVETVVQQMWECGAPCRHTTAPVSPTKPTLISVFAEGGRSCQSLTILSADGAVLC